MEFKRNWMALRSRLMKSSLGRARYYKKHNIFHFIGNNVSIHSRRIPLYPNLISLHDNVKLAANVIFVTHDITYRMLRPMFPGKKIPEKIGCIEIMENVFVGANSIILSGVRIGPNVIVAAGSVVAKDVPAGSVVGGVPAKVIGTFDDFVAKRFEEIEALKGMPAQPAKHIVPKVLEEFMWDAFYEDKGRP